MIKKLARVSSVSKKMIDMFTVNITSNQSIENIISNVQEMCDKFGFTLLQTYNYHEIVESKGFPIKRKVFIYEICQAKTAALMLTSNPNFSIFMPCKLAIYEFGSQTIISTMDMEIMLSAVKSDETLFQEATSLFGKLKSLMISLS
jgi:uncharacterized protein (DUF302 family)